MSTKSIPLNKYAQKIYKIEKELFKLKKEKFSDISKIPISLKGTLKGLKIIDKDVRESKKSLFKKIKI